MADPPETTDNISADSSNPPDTIDNQSDNLRESDSPEVPSRDIESACPTRTSALPDARDNRIGEAVHPPSEKSTADCNRSGVEPSCRLLDVSTEQISMDDLCRLCLVRCADEMQRLFDDVALADNILALAQLQMFAGDGLPELVCRHCLRQLRSALAFIAQCRHSDHTLREYFHKLHLASSPIDREPYRVEEGIEQKRLTGAEPQGQRNLDGRGKAARVAADCSEKPKVAGQFPSSILSCLLQRPANTIKRERLESRERGARGVDSLVRRDENLRRERRDVAVVAPETNARQPMDITNVVNNRYVKDVEHHTSPKKHDHRLTNCDKAQDLMTGIVSGLTGRDAKTYSGEENHSDAKLLKTIKKLGIAEDRNRIFDDVESRLELMMGGPKLTESKDVSVKPLNVRSKADQNKPYKRSIYIDQALDDLKEQLRLPIGKRGKHELAEELRNSVNKQNSKRIKLANGDLSAKRSLCEELLSSFRGRVIESMTVYVGSTEAVKREDAQVKADEENVDNVGSVAVELLAGNKDTLQRTGSVEGGECLTNGIKIEAEPIVDQEESRPIVIRIVGPDSRDRTNIAVDQEQEFRVIVQEHSGDDDVHYKDGEVEDCAEEPYRSDEVITSDVVFTVPTADDAYQCKVEGGSEINGEILFFDVQEEVVIETADFDLNNLPADAHILEYPSTSAEASVKLDETGEYAFACETCTKSFKRKKALLSHMKLHTFINFGLEHEQKKDPTNKLYKCDVCFKCYISKAGLKIHRNRVHEEGKFACPECDLFFASKLLLVAHIKTHKQKVYKCNRCMKTFLKRKTFVAHTRIHAQNIYKCATCLETYGDEDDLKEHFKSHKAHDVATGQSLQPGGSRNEAQVEQFQRMKFEYCLSYVGLVKSMFETQPDLYNGFLDTIKDFKFQRINVQGLLVQISELFKDHRELIAGFNTFMPHGFKIELPHEDKLSGIPEPAPVPEQQGPDMDLDYSLSYLSQIKSMFSNQPKIYNDFTYIIKEYKLKTMEIPEVIRRVSHLFRDYPELIAGFNSFLPPWCKIKVAPSVRKEKEDIDPMEPSSRPGPSSAPAACNGKAVEVAPAVAVGRHKRKPAPPVATSVDHFKKVKMELLASDKVFKTINQTNRVSEPALPRIPPPAEVAAPQSQNIVETITSLCDQLQTIVDKQAQPSVDEAADVDTSEATDAAVYSHVCHVCLKSFQKRNLLQVHLKEHKR